MNSNKICHDIEHFDLANTMEMLVDALLSHTCICNGCCGLHPAERAIYSVDPVTNPIPRHAAGVCGTSKITHGPGSDAVCD